MGSYCGKRICGNEEMDMKFTQINSDGRGTETEKIQIKAIIKKLNYQKKELEKKVKDNQKKYNDYDNDIQTQLINFEIYKKTIHDLNCELNEHYSNIIITSFYESHNSETNNNINEDNDNDIFANALKNLSQKIKSQNINVKNLKKNEIIYIQNINNSIQEKLNEINNNEKLKNNSLSLQNILEINNEIIYNQIHEYEEKLNDLENKKNLYNYMSKDLEKEIQQIKNKIKEHLYKAENSKKPTIKIEEEKSIDQNETIREPFYLDNSMPLAYNYPNINDVYSSNSSSNESNKENKESKDNKEDKEIKDNVENKESKDNKGNKENKEKGLFRKNWNETVYIYNNYDLHDISFDLAAINIPPKTFYDSYNLGLNRSKTIEIIDFKIDEKCQNYDFNNNNIQFDIHLGNNKYNKIILKYKEFPNINKLSEGEIKERQFYRNEIYGLSKKLKGQKAKYNLIIKCDFEVISFEDEFLMKINEKEYTWSGIVPQEGKKTAIKLSKLEAKYSFNIYKKIQAINKQSISKMKFVFPLYFEGGNNRIIKISYSSNQMNQMHINKDKKEYEINFVNIKDKYVDFSIEGELINRCKGDWNCDLTDEEIEKEIPEDYKINKNIFRKKAEKIIKDYDIEHKNDLIQISNFAKIGKWIRKNIKYDEDYIGKNEISASEILEDKKGVCHHFTKLYNALIYSLGYQCIYVSGYVVEKRDIFEKEDYHCWTLIKVDGKWLPFDVTWGIFTGKLPVTHVFDSYFSKGLNTRGSSRIKIIENKVYGKFLE